MIHSGLHDDSFSGSESKLKVILPSISNINLSSTMNQDRESIQRMIHDTVTVVCRNSLSHGVGVRIQGLIGITVDDSEVFLIQFDESYGNDVDDSELSEQQNVDSAAVAERDKSNPRKRPRLSETVAPPTSCHTPAAEQPAADDSDSDVIFVADQVNDNSVKLELDRFCRSAHNNSNYDQTDSSGLFNTSNNLANRDLDVYTNDGEYQSGRGVNHGGARNMLLRNMLADENDYPSDQATGWQSESVSYEETTVQTTSVKHEQTTTRPRVKQEYWSQPARQIIRRYRQRQQHQQQQALAACGNGGVDQLVITRSLHECGYPGCGKQFRHRQHLLRHQTQKHGRTPTRVLGLQKVWMRPEDVSCGQSFGSTGVSYY